MLRSWAIGRVLGSRVGGVVVTRAAGAHDANVSPWTLMAADAKGATVRWVDIDSKRLHARSDDARRGPQGSTSPGRRCAWRPTQPAPSTRSTTSSARARALDVRRRRPLRPPTALSTSGPPVEPTSSPARSTSSSGHASPSCSGRPTAPSQAAPPAATGARCLRVWHPEPQGDVAATIEGDQYLASSVVVPSAGNARGSARWPVGDSTCTPRSRP